MWKRAAAAWTHARRRRWVRWTIDVAIILVAVFAVGAWQTRGHLRDAAPPFTAPLLEGGEVSLSSLRGKPVLLEFWAPWCTVCKAQSQNISWLKALVAERAHVYSIASSYEDRAQVDSYVRDKAVDYPVLLGGEQLARQYKVDAYPTLYFLDRDGRIKHSAVGYTTSVGLLWRLLW